MRGWARRLAGGICRVGQYTQRRFQRVRQIAGLRARPLDHDSILGKHGIELLDQRLDFSRKASFKALLASIAHCSQCAAQALKPDMPLA